MKQAVGAEKRCRQAIWRACLALHAVATWGFDRHCQISSWLRILFHVFDPEVHPYLGVCDPDIGFELMSGSMLPRVIRAVGSTFTSARSLPPVVLLVCFSLYSLSLKYPAFQQFEKSSKSASAGSYRPIWNSFATVGVREF